MIRLLDLSGYAHAWGDRPQCRNTKWMINYNLLNGTGSWSPLFHKFSLTNLLLPCSFPCSLSPIPQSGFPSVASLKWIIFTLTKTIADAARSTIEITEEKCWTDTRNAFEEREPDRIMGQGGWFQGLDSYSCYYQFCSLAFYSNTFVLLPFSNNFVFHWLLAQIRSYFSIEFSLVSP